MHSKGTGFPVLVIPGIQGRWEWMAPTVDALTAGHRVITVSLNELRPRIERDGAFTAWTHLIDEVLDQARERQAAIIGVSFGGLIAARYAARRPERVTALVLASTPAPRWRPTAGDTFCLNFPYLALPFFGARGAMRLLPELLAARDSWPQRLEFTREHLGRILRAPMHPGLSAQWMREFLAHDMTAECKRITAPTLVVTGESRLDRVVPVRDSKKYLKLIPGATHTVLEGTGHVGVVSRPYRFSQIVGPFIYAAQVASREETAAEARSRHAS
jgi:pimeloyl-ACP methyl ester carboxylesterase